MKILRIAWLEEGGGTEDRGRKAEGGADPEAVMNPRLTAIDSIWEWCVFGFFAVWTWVLMAWQECKDRAEMRRLNRLEHEALHLRIRLRVVERCLRPATMKGQCKAKFNHE